MIRCWCLTSQLIVSLWLCSRSHKLEVVHNERTNGMDMAKVSVRIIAPFFCWPLHSIEKQRISIGILVALRVMYCVLIRANRPCSARILNDHTWIAIFIHFTMRNAQCINSIQWACVNRWSWHLPPDFFTARSSFAHVMCMLCLSVCSKSTFNIGYICGFMVCYL